MEDEIFISEVIVYHKDKQIKLGNTPMKFENEKYYSLYTEDYGCNCPVLVTDEKEFRKIYPDYYNYWKAIK